MDKSKRQWTMLECQKKIDTPIDRSSQWGLCGMGFFTFFIHVGSSRLTFTCEDMSKQWVLPFWQLGIFEKQLY